MDDGRVNAKRRRPAVLLRPKPRRPPYWTRTALAVRGPHSLLTVTTPLLP